MSNKIRLILGSYLSNFDLEIQSISFLKGGNISKDSLTVQYYAKKRDSGIFAQILSPQKAR
jgi:hypothetical protein